MLGKICPQYSVIPPPHQTGTEMMDPPYLKGSGNLHHGVQFQKVVHNAPHGVQLPLFSYPVVHKCLSGGAARQTDRKRCIRELQWVSVNVLWRFNFFSTPVTHSCNIYAHYGQPEWIRHDRPCPLIWP